MSEKKLHNSKLTITHEGVTKTLRERSEQTGISVNKLWYRLTQSKVRWTTAEILGFEKRVPPWQKRGPLGNRDKGHLSNANRVMSQSKRALNDLVYEERELPDNTVYGGYLKKRLMRAFNEMTPIDRRSPNEDPLCMIPEWFYDC